MGAGVVLLSLLLAMSLVASPSIAQTSAAQPPSEAAAPATEAVRVLAEQARPELKRPTTWGEPTEVRIGIYVIDVDAVDSANQNFSASVYYEARWNSLALRHEGPGPKIVPTTAVWTPRLTIVNQQQAWSAFPALVEISPEGEAVYRQKSWGWFSQPLNLRDFPMDRQTLTIHIIAAGMLETDVKLVPLARERGRRSGIAETFSLPDFSVLSSNAESRAYTPFKDQAGVAGYIMEMKIERNPRYYFWKLILPLCLIVAMSWVPRWIKQEEMGTGIGIAATSFLTLVAYLFATAVLLPRVSYFTRMDQFILLSTLMVFISLIQTVMTDWLAGASKSRIMFRLNVFSRVLYPVILLGVLGISFVW